LPRLDSIAFTKTAIFIKKALKTAKKTVLSAFLWVLLRQRLSAFQGINAWEGLFRLPQALFKCCA
jgi:hypothetical protein